MSGGYFEYNQYIINDIANDIEKLVKTEKYLSDKVMEKFKETMHCCKRCSEMVQRIDWLVSCDDGEDSFLERWEKEVRPCNPSKEA